jgi:hypothetical protein
MSKFDFGMQGDYKKGIKKTRAGGPTDGSTGIVGEGAAFHANLTKRKMTPNQIAACNFFNALKVYPEIGADLRRIRKDQIVEMDQLRYMNMAHLAAAIVLLHDIGGIDKLSPVHFNNETFDKFLPNLTKSNSEINEKGHKEIVLAYMRTYVFAMQNGLTATQDNTIANLDDPNEDEDKADQIALEEAQTTV